MNLPRCLSLLTTVLVFWSTAAAAANNPTTDTSSANGDNGQSRFTEELLIRPLPSGHVYSHFEFTTTWSNPDIEDSIDGYKDYKLEHYSLFPRALGEVVEQYHVRELHLSLSQGLWRHHKWGYPVNDAPPGATLWVWFTPGPEEQLDQTWRDLVNALSGLFCASLNFIDATNTASPLLSYRPQGLADKWYANNSSYLRYAALARENVCTENLTPWKKLLPCDTKAGLASTLYPGPVYSSHYHSLGVHLRPACQESGCQQSHLELVLSVSLVQQRLQDGKQDFTLRHLYSSPLFSSCPLANASMVYVDVTGNEDLSQFSLSPAPDSIEQSGGDAASHRALAVYDARQHLVATGDAFNVAVRYRKAHVYSLVPSPPLLVTRYIAGYGQEGGSIHVVLTNNGKESMSVVYLELLPWYLRLYLHPTHAHNTAYLSQLVTARDRERGWVYESVVTVPGGGESVHLSLTFTRALLKWLEYPPDANHGFYLAAATVSVMLPDARNVSGKGLDTRMLYDKLQVSPGPSFVRIHTETLLVSLPTPDFSMPYNVICLACTVVALAFGPIHNITTKRLTLKKVDTNGSVLSKIKSKLRRLLRLKAADDTVAPVDTPSDAPHYCADGAAMEEPVTVEERHAEKDECNCQEEEESINRKEESGQSSSEGAQEEREEGEVKEEPQIRRRTRQRKDR